MRLEAGGETPAEAEWRVEGVFVISVASRLLEMHPQTLRKYERLGLVSPSRTMGMRRLYSQEEIVRLRLIKHLVEDMGMNLAGVEFTLSMVNRLEEMRARLRAMVTQEDPRDWVEHELEGLFRLLHQAL